MDKMNMILNLGNRAVNNYLVSFDEGYILIDTGYEGGCSSALAHFFCLILDLVRQFEFVQGD